MKLKEWIEFHNTKNNGITLYYGDLVVCGIKFNSMSKSDEIFTTTISIDRAKQLFGDFRLKMISVAERQSGNGYTIRALVEIPDILN